MGYVEIWVFVFMRRVLLDYMVLCLLILGNIRICSMLCKWMFCIIFCARQSTEKVEEGKSAKKVSKTIDFCSMKDALQTKWKTLHSERKRGPKVPKVLVYWEGKGVYQSMMNCLNCCGSFAELSRCEWTITIDGELCDIEKTGK